MSAVTSLFLMHMIATDPSSFDSEMEYSTRFFSILRWILLHNYIRGN